MDQTDENLQEYRTFEHHNEKFDLMKIYVILHAMNEEYMFSGRT